LLFYNTYRNRMVSCGDGLSRYLQRDSMMVKGRNELKVKMSKL